MQSNSFSNLFQITLVKVEFRESRESQTNPIETDMIETRWSSLYIKRGTYFDLRNFQCLVHIFPITPQDDNGIKRCVFFAHLLNYVKSSLIVAHLLKRPRKIFKKIFEVEFPGN